MNDFGGTLVNALLSFGSNLGSRHESFARALESLQGSGGIESVTASLPVVTRPVGGPAEQPDFLNAAIRLQTTLSPHALHARLLEIETKLGRQRRVRWGSRKIDLDLLLHANHEFTDTELLIPHPRMSFRRFVLEPSSEIAGEMIHPTSGLTISQLLNHLNSMPNVITIIRPQTAQAAWDTIVTSVFESDRSASNWTIVCQTPAEFSPEVHRPKLVVFDSRELPAKQREAIIRYRGPTLNFSGQSFDSKSYEISAALSAM